MNFIPTFYPKVKYLIIFARLLTTLPYIMAFGGAGVTKFPFTTTITGLVTDNIPNEVVSATNTYAIRWHMVVENYGPPATIPNNDYIGDLKPIDINTVQTVNIPGKEADATFGATGQLQTIGLVVGVGGALFPEVGLSETATYVVQAMCAGTSYQLGLTPENNTQESITGDAHYPEWCADINKQATENNTGSTDDSVKFFL